jgi:hypothetical protein
VPLFKFASAASRESLVQAANKASQATPNNVAPAGSVIAFKGVLMFGTKLRHKVFSLSLFCLAAALLVSVALKVYEQGTVTFNTASGFGGVLFILSIALIPEFFFLKFSEALELRVKSRREKISEKLLYSGMLLVIIGFIGRVAL